MKRLNKKDNQITFTAEINESLANAIRRYLNQIQVFAIDEVEISRNDSPLYDETVAHRLGLIPLQTKKATDGKKEIKFKLSSNKEGMVYSGELTGGAKTVYDKIPITTLKKGQELKVAATAKLGKGSEHSKFSPGLLFYRNVIDVRIDKDCPVGVVDVCPKKILKTQNGKVVVTDNYLCDMCEVCTETCKKLKKNSIKLIPTKELTIILESFGHLNVEDIFKKSIGILKKDLAEVSKKINK